MDYIAALESAFGVKAQISMLPLQPGDVPGTSADLQDLVEQFNYRPATAVADGIKRFVDWYRSYCKI